MRNLFSIFILVLWVQNVSAHNNYVNSDYTILKDSVVTTAFSIKNLSCGADASAMQKAISQTKGVKTCKVDHMKGIMVVTYAANKISKEEIIKVIENCSLCHDKNDKPFKAMEIENRQ